MQNTSNSQYKTKDLGEAAALMASGVKFAGLVNGGGFYWFIFSHDNAESTANDYWSNELTVKAKAYFDCMRTLKDRLFAQ